MATTAILAAAEAVVGEAGVEGARIEEIARRAGIAVGTVYNYFEDRDGLMGALRDARKAELVATLDEAVAAGEGRPFAAQLEAFVRAALGYYEQHRQFFAVLIGAEPGGTGVPMPVRKDGHKPIYAVAEKLMQRGVRAGALRAAHASLYPGLLFGLMRGAALVELSRKGPAPLTDLVEPIVQLFLHGASTERGERGK